MPDVTVAAGPACGDGTAVVHIRTPAVDAVVKPSNIADGRAARTVLGTRHIGNGAGRQDAATF
jgi:hypothetical protein